MRFATFGEPVVEIITDFQVYVHSKCQLLYIDTAELSITNCTTIITAIWLHCTVHQLLTKELAADLSAFVVLLLVSRVPTVKR